MIRLIQRRLIIPRGDTGSFSIPTLGKISEGDVAIFGIFDLLTHKTVVTKIFNVTGENLIISLKAEDTINLEPKKYNWDITIFHSPQFNEDGELIGAAEVNSYYSAFKLPICEIRETVRNLNSEEWKSQDIEDDNIIYESSFSNIQAVYPWEIK